MTKVQQIAIRHSSLFDKSVMYNHFDQIYKSSNLFDMPCLSSCTGICEYGPILLMPYEYDYIIYKAQLNPELFKFQLIEENGFAFHFISDEDTFDCPFLDPDSLKCKAFPYRPLDCQTYPIFPLFLKDRIEFHLSIMCPLQQSITKEFIDASKTVWTFASGIIPSPWKEFYNGHVMKYFSTHESREV